jgi:hypothetical protein
MGPSLGPKRVLGAICGSSELGLRSPFLCMSHKACVGHVGFCGAGVYTSRDAMWWKPSLSHTRHVLLGPGMAALVDTHLEL